MGIDVLTLDERRLLLLSVGTHRGRRPLTPIEVSAVFKKIVDSAGSLQDCATAAGLEGTTIVSRFLRLQRLPHTITHLVDWGSTAGSVGFSTAAEAARLPEISDQEALFDAVLRHKLSGSEGRQVVQLRIRSRRPVEECVREVVAMRPRIERRYVYVGAIADDRIRARLAVMTQHERDDMLGRIITTALDGKKPSVAKLGVDRFTLTGGKEFVELFSTNRDLVETRVNQGLTSELI